MVTQSVGVAAISERRGRMLLLYIKKQSLGQNPPEICKIEVPPVHSAGRNGEMKPNYFSPADYGTEVR